MDEQTKNLILATALSFLVLLTWMFLFPPAPIPENNGLNENQIEELYSEIYKLIDQLLSKMK